MPVPQKNGDVMKKLTFNSLAFGNLKHRKKQYTLLIIGIILSMVFSASIPFLVSSAYSSAEATKNAWYGEEDIIVPGADFNDKCIPALENSFRYVGYASTYGYLFNPKAEEGSGFSFSYFDDVSAQMYLDIEEGGLPQYKNEIAIEREALQRMGVKAKIGDKITLEMLTQKGEELSEISQPVTFVLTGILENKRPNIEEKTVLDYKDLPAAVVSEKYLIPAGGKALTTAFVSTGEFFDQKEYDRQFSAFYENYGSNNSEVPLFEIARLAKYDVLQSITGLASPGTLLVVLCFVLTLVADIGIVNAFSANLKERKKQIGLLRSVGATKRQIIKIYGRESFILCLICAPVSAIISLGIVALIVPFLGENYVFEPELWIIPISVLLSIIFVLIASFIPLISAARISPMQAIRNTELGRKFKNKKIKTQKNFDTSKLLAKRNITLFRGKGVIISIIVCISVFISLFGFSVVNALEDQFAIYSNDYTISASNYFSNGWLSNYKSEYRGLSENNLSEIILNENVQSVSTQKTTNAYIQTDEFTDYMDSLCYFNWQYRCDPENIWVTKENYKQYTATNNAEFDFAMECAQIQGKVVKFDLIGYDDEIIQELSACVAEGEIDIDKLNSGEEVIVMIPENVLLTVSHYEETKKYSYIHSFNTTIEEDPNLATEDVFLDQTTCDFTVGQNISVGWLFAENAPELDGDIYHFSKDQQPINYEKIISDVNIGSIVHHVPFESEDSILSELSFWGNPRIITTIEGFDKLTEGNVQYHRFGVTLNTACTEEINRDMLNLLNRVSAGAERTIISSYEKRQQQIEDMRASLIIIIAVATLFFTACGSMVNNAITARIRESKREIGTLRAVGATQKDINNSYFRQIFSILGWGVVAGFVTFFIYYGIYYLVFISLGDIPSDYKITIIETLIGVALLFITCTLNMLFKIKKEMKNSIVENIREL